MEHSGKYDPVPAFLECVAGIKFKMSEYMQNNNISTSLELGCKIGKTFLPAFHLLVSGDKILFAFSKCLILTLNL